ncbi:methyltransferase domain-containing protein [bacterium]
MITKKEFNTIFNRIYQESDKGQKDELIFHKERYFITIKEISFLIEKVIKEPVDILEIGPGDYFLARILIQIYPQKIKSYEGLEKRYFKTISGSTPYNGFKTHIKDIEGETVNLNKKYNIILCLEVIEHLLYNPTMFLSNIYNNMSIDSFLMLTTDNVCRLINIFKLLSGKNVYHPYKEVEDFRHNREYTYDEMLNLLKGIGYEIKIAKRFNFTPVLNGKFKTLLYRFFNIISEIFYRYKRHMLFLCKRTSLAPNSYKPIEIYEGIYE